MKRRPSFAAVVALLALFVALGGPAHAQRMLGKGSVKSREVKDGSLTASDLGRFWGRFRIDVPAVLPGTCWSGEPAGLAPELAGADISQDVVLVTPDSKWPEDRLSFTVRNSANPMRFVLAGCNRTNTDVPAFEVAFRYVIIDLP